MRNIYLYATNQSKQSRTTISVIFLRCHQNHGRLGYFFRLFSFFVPQFSSVRFSCSVVSDCLQPQGLQRCQASLSITNSWSLPKLMSIESVMPSSVIPFSSCPQSLPASESFPRSQFFASGGQSIGDSASASVLPMNIQVDFF